VKVGDVVMTKVPGFGTGNVSKIGTIIETQCFDQYSAGTVQVMHDDGTFLEWYPWQLEEISENL
jgi:hypothetical protein